MTGMAREHASTVEARSDNRLTLAWKRRVVGEARGADSVRSRLRSEGGGNGGG